MGSINWELLIVQVLFIELVLYPEKSVTDGKEEVVENVVGKAVIEGDTLTLAMESDDVILTKK